MWRWSRRLDGRRVALGVASLVLAVAVAGAYAIKRSVGPRSPDTDTVSVGPIERLPASHQEFIESSTHASVPGVPIMRRISEYRARLETNPNDLEALIALANANYDIQRWELARDLYRRALAIDPKNPFVRTDLASSLRRMGDVEGAIAELEAVLKNDPKHGAALYNLGVILLRDKGDRKRAIQLWERLIALDPSNPTSKRLAEKVAELKKGGSPAG